jgi:hypothetical protein
MKIAVHEVEGDVEVSVALCLDYMPDFDDIVMIVKTSEVEDLPERTLGIYWSTETFKTFLNSAKESRLFINGLPNYTVRALP